MKMPVIVSGMALMCGVLCATAFAAGAGVAGLSAAAAAVEAAAVRDDAAKKAAEEKAKTREFFFWLGVLALSLVLLAVIV